LKEQLAMRDAEVKRGKKALAKQKADMEALLSAESDEREELLSAQLAEALAKVAKLEKASAARSNAQQQAGGKSAVDEEELDALKEQLAMRDAEVKRGKKALAKQKADMDAQNSAAQLRIKLQNKEQKMKLHANNAGAGMRMLNTIFSKGREYFTTSSFFFTWTLVTYQTKITRKKCSALNTMLKCAIQKSVRPSQYLDRWYVVQKNEQKLLHSMRTVGLKLMTKIKARLLLVYTQELIKTWDKRHDAWIAQMSENQTKKNAGLRGIASIVKKMDLQKIGTLASNWKKMMAQETQRRTGLQLVKGILAAWDKQTKKSIIMNWKALMRVNLGKQKLDAKKEAADAEFNKQTEIVKKQVKKIVQKTQKDHKKRIEKLERELTALQSENGELRRRLVTA